MSSKDPVRLNKLMALRGLCSRREADQLIAQGLVRVDGQQVKELGQKVAEDADIQITWLGKRALDEKVTILINKPVGYVSAQAEKGYKCALDLITNPNQDGERKSLLKDKHRSKLAPAGRLDIDSQGLLVFTQDGTLAKKLIGADSEIEKEYLVRVRGKLQDHRLEVLQNGSLVIDDRKLKPAKVEWLNEDQLRFVLTEGVKRQIRRMCEAVGLEVTGLKRVRIGKVMLGSLPEGKWRFLRADEQF